MLRQRAVRPFASIEDLKLRVPAIQKSELAALAEIGALNFIAGKQSRAVHRRDALWQIERAARRAGPLLESSAAMKMDSEEIERVPGDEKDEADNNKGKNKQAELILETSAKINRRFHR